MEELFNNEHEEELEPEGEEEEETTTEPTTPRPDDSPNGQHTPTQTPKKKRVKKYRSNIRGKKLTPKTKEELRTQQILTKYQLTLQQEMFCRYFTSPSEFYGNGIQSYSLAYNHDISSPRGYAVARSRASSLLSSLNIMTRIDDLLQTTGLNDQNVDKQLLHVIVQNAEYSSKVAAIREYNKLKKRIDDRSVLEMPVTRVEIVQATPKKNDPEYIDTSKT